MSDKECGHSGVLMWIYRQLPRKRLEEKVQHYWEPNEANGQMDSSGIDLGEKIVIGGNYRGRNSVN